MNCPEDDISEFLMDNLKEVTEIISDPNVQAYAVVTTIAACGSKICESLLRLYIAPLQVQIPTFLDHLAWFHGGMLLEIECDCSNFSFCLVRQLDKHDSFKDGMMARISGSFEFEQAQMYIKRLADNLGDC